MKRPPLRESFALGRASALFVAVVGMGAVAPLHAQSKCSSGPDQCKAGMVWRDAFANDHVCVTPAARTQAAKDNVEASKRRNPSGAYGPNTCIAGYVWREASPADQVCVGGAERDQARTQNSQAPANVDPACAAPAPAAKAAAAPKMPMLLGHVTSAPVAVAPLAPPAVPAKAAGLLLPVTTPAASTGNNKGTSSTSSAAVGVVGSGGGAQVAGNNTQQVRQWIDGLPRMAIVQPTVGQPFPVALPPDMAGAGYTGTQRNVKEVSNSSTMYLFRPFSPAFVPGAVVQGATISGTAPFATIDLPRAPGRLRLTGGFVSPSAASRFRDLPEARGGEVDNARIGLLNAIGATDSAGTSEFQYVYARSMQDAMVKLGVSYDAGPSASVAFDGSLQTTATDTMIVGRFTQVFYSAAFEPDPATQAFFAPSVTLSDVQRMASPSNPPLYVSQVLYGRLLFVTFRSKASQVEVEAALKASYNKVKGSLDAKFKNTLAQTEIKVVQIGQTGQASINPAQIQDSETLQQAMARFIDQGARYNPSTNPGLPIGVVLNYIGSGAPGQVAISQMTTDYSEIVNIQAPNEQCLTHQVWDGPGGGWTQPLQSGKPVRINPGDSVRFNASGEIWSGVPLSAFNGPDGWPTDPTSGPRSPVLNRPPFALIGRFGDDNFSGDDPKWGGNCNTQSGAGCSGAFWIGQARTVVAGEAVNVKYGDLWLGENDIFPNDGRADKKWSVNVCIARKDYGDQTTHGKSPQL